VESVVGEQCVQLGVALVDADLHAAGEMALRPSSESTTETEVTRLRPSPRSVKVMASRLTPSGMPSQVKVCTSRSPGRASWNEP
jgi:hypothetical protein